MIKFNDTTNENGLIQLCEDFCGFNRGEIANNEKLLKQFTNKINNGVDNIIGTLYPLNKVDWQLDDSNYTNYPIVVCNLQAGIQQVILGTDESQAVILDVWKVVIKDKSGKYKTLKVRDAHSDKRFNIVDVELGEPTAYDKCANGILFDRVPDYDFADGVIIYINRETTKFVYTDTDVSLGLAMPYHIYMAYYASAEWLLAGNYATAQTYLAKEMLTLEKIKTYYANRNKDFEKKLTTKTTPTR